MTRKTIRKRPQLWQRWLLWKEALDYKNRHHNRREAILAGRSNLDLEIEEAALFNMYGTGKSAYDIVDEYMDLLREEAQLVAPVVYEWLTSIKGVAGATAAKIIALFDDIGKAPRRSNAWRYSGLGIYQYWINSRGEVKAPKDGWKWVKNAKGEKERVKTVAEPRNGWELVSLRDRSVPGWCRPFNSDLKSVLLFTVGNLIRLSGRDYAERLYVDFYYDEKLALREEYPESFVDEFGKTRYNDGHVDGMARRKTAKLLVSHLWQVWRESEGLPVSEPYSFEKLGHQTLIEPPNWPLPTRYD